jgi:ribosomal 30S subunit maturation factor RimM
MTISKEEIIMKKALAVITIVIAMSSIAIAQPPPVTAPTAKPALQTAIGRFRASDILGVNVKNAAGDTVGEVKDLVILRDQQVLQAVLSVGGFLGIGDKLVAIPYDKLQVRRIDNKINAIYDTTKAEIEGMPKFPYIESDMGGLTLRAHDLIGADVKNTADETIGEVDDLIITATDNVPLAILSVGGFLGAGEKLVAVPYKDLSIKYVDDKQQVTYNATKEELKALSSFTYN